MSFGALSGPAKEALGRGASIAGGIMNSAEALTAWFNPTINSYKRINAPVTDSGKVNKPTKDKTKL